MCGCLFHALHWGRSPQPKHVPWLGIELVILWFKGPHSLSYTSQALPSLKREGAPTLCGTHTAALSQCPALHALHFSKRQKVFLTGLSLLVPPTVLGASITLLDSPSWHCSYGHAACCVCAAWASQNPYILPSLSPSGLGVPYVGAPLYPTLGGARATKLHFLTSILSLAGTSGYFPFNI